MALRELTDREGVSWRVWDITPETTHPATRIEDYLQGFIDGWLVFETADGMKKRRLYPLPARWEEASEQELVRLLGGATPVAAPGASERSESRVGEHPRRTFTYPGGGEWTVAETPVIYRDRDGQTVDMCTVLRFSSGTRNLDLLAWPRDWPRRSDDELAELLWRAFPRESRRPRAGEAESAREIPMRRRDEGRA